MNWYKTAQNDIHYLGDYNYSGNMFVHFQIEDKYWVYKMPFQDLVEKIKKMAYISSSKALAFANKHKRDAFKVSKGWPLNGGIEREEYTKEEIKERAQSRKQKTQAPVQQELNF
jgi:hypothetical protein